MWGNTTLSPEKFDFYYSMIVSVNIRDSFLRVVIQDENPAVVALDWST